MNDRSAGFTLIELLVAITLASLVALLGALVLRAAIDFHDDTAQHIKAGEDLRAADRLLMREWSGRGAQNLLAIATRIEFRTDQLADPYAVGVASDVRVRYLCSDTDDGEMAFERLLLGRAENDTPRSAVRGSPAGAERSGATEGWHVLRTEVLIPRLLGCRFDYLAPRQNRDGKIAEWREEIAPGEPPPRLLRLTLATARGEIAPLVYDAEG